MFTTGEFCKHAFVRVRDRLVDLRAVVLAVSIGIVAAGCSSPSPPAERRTEAEQATAPTQSSDASPLQGAALVLDVRNPDEYAQGHLENATLIPVAELAQRLSEVEAAVGGDKSKKIVTYCGSGRRAGKAQELLEQHGYTNVVNGGGYKDLR